MKTSLLNHPRGFVGKTLVSLLFVILLVAAKGYGQDLPNPTPNLQTIPAGSIIIPMDDAKQSAPTGPSGASRFNLKAYGLIQRLLQNNIPMRWAIKAGKAKDAVDFTAHAARLFPSSAAAANVSFSGGPFIVAQGYETIALQVINGFRNEKPPNDATDVNAQNVAVYQTDTATNSVDIRYTVTHKPKIAIGQNTGITSGVHQKLYDFALINDYSNVDNTTINDKSCYTIATQPHFDSPNFISQFNQFLSSGGNILLQCLSITTFENTATGHFQTTNGWAGYANGTTNLTTTPLHANVDMPFAQFIGSIPGDVTAAVADYDLKGISPGATHNSFFKVEFNNAVGSGNSSHPESYVASEAVITGPGGAGGAVFELGGHDYFQSGTAAAVANYNAQRMILNALFVPVIRPAVCGLQVPVIFSYKSVKLTTDVNNNHLVSPGDTLTWTITYVNTTPIVFPNFQITDGPLDSKVDYVPGTITAVGTGGATTGITANASFNGAGNVNMLTSGGTLDIGGKIVITIQTKVKANATAGQILNQTNATGTNVAGVGVKSDALDSATQGVQGGVTPPPGSIPQTQQTGGVDPTIANILIPTAAQASITGRVIAPEGFGIARAQITVSNPTTGVNQVVYTNPFGFFTVTGVDVGSLYIVSVSARGYQFPIASHSFVVNDDVVGLVFAAAGSGGKIKNPIITDPIKTTLPTKGAGKIGF